MAKVKPTMAKPTVVVSKKMTTVPKAKKVVTKSPESKKKTLKLKQQTEKKIKRVNVSIEHETITNAIDAVFQFLDKSPKYKNYLFQDEKIPLFLQIGCFQIPKGNTKIFRIDLKHSILTPEDEVCLIVAEVKGILNKEHEQHVQVYEDILRKNEAQSLINKIMTFHEFRTEYGQFEQRKRLVNLYDAFLVDGKVSGKVVAKCGQIFYQNRKIPNPIRMQATQLKSNIERSLKRTQLHVSQKGKCMAVQFGHTKMEKLQIAENFLACAKFLNDTFPGGFANIQELDFYVTEGISVPVYISLNAASNVAVPVERPVKPKGSHTYTDELTTKLKRHAVVKPSGTVTLKQAKKALVEEENDSEASDEEDINLEEIPLPKGKKNKVQAGSPLKGKKNLKPESAPEVNGAEVVLPQKANKKKAPKENVPKNAAKKNKAAPKTSEPEEGKVVAPVKANKNKSKKPKSESAPEVNAVEVAAPQKTSPQKTKNKPQKAIKSAEAKLPKTVTKKIKVEGEIVEAPAIVNENGDSPKSAQSPGKNKNRKRKNVQEVAVGEGSPPKQTKNIAVLSNVAVVAKPNKKALKESPETVKPNKKAAKKLAGPAKKTQKANKENATN